MDETGTAAPATPGSAGWAEAARGSGEAESADRQNGQCWIPCMAEGALSSPALETTTFFRPKLVHISTTAPPRPAAIA